MEVGTPLRFSEPSITGWLNIPASTRGEDGLAAAVAPWAAAPPAIRAPIASAAAVRLIISCVSLRSITVYTPMK